MGDVRELRDFIVSDRFVRVVSSLEPVRLASLLLAMGRLDRELRERIGPLIKVTPTKAFKWNDMLIARLRKAEEQYGDDELIARSLGLTMEAARRARLRYIGRRAEISTTTTSCIAEAHAEAA